MKSSTTWIVIRWMVALTLVTASGWMMADDDEEHEHERRIGGVSRRTETTNQARTLPVLIHKAWNEECSSCHMLYHPALLPERSWNKMMGGLSKHFGEDASLDPKVQADISTFLAANSADRGQTRRGARIASTIPANTAPLRIVETPYFKYQHDELKPAVFKLPKVGSPSNCIACHPGAEKANFSEDAVRIPR